MSGARHHTCPVRPRPEPPITNPAMSRCQAPGHVAKNEWAALPTTNPQTPRWAASSPSCGDDIRGRTGSARAAVLSPTGPHRHRLPVPTELSLAKSNKKEKLCGGPEGKLRGRPPPPVEPRSGPWRRTGSESAAGRAQTRRESSIAHSCLALQPGEPDKAREAPLRRRFRRRGTAFGGQLPQGQGRMAEPELRYLTKLRRELRQRSSPLEALDRTDLSLGRTTRPDEVRVIGVRQPVGPRLRCSHHALLFE